jgi:transposase-like protein
VRTGDTLTSIAREFGTTTESLSYWNRVAYPSLDPDSPTYRPNDIRVGWTLLIVPNDVVDPENLPPGGPTPEPEEPEESLEPEESDEVE